MCLSSVLHCQTCQSLWWWRLSVCNVSPRHGQPACESDIDVKQICSWFCLTTQIEDKLYRFLCLFCASKLCFYWCWQFLFWWRQFVFKCVYLFCCRLLNLVLGYMQRIWIMDLLQLCGLIGSAFWFWSRLKQEEFILEIILTCMKKGKESV